MLSNLFEGTQHIQKHTTTKQNKTHTYETANEHNQQQPVRPIKKATY